MITRNEILLRTHYGTKIYSHYMRRYFPDRIVMHLVGRDCGNCPNPFNEGKESLHVWHEKIYPERFLSPEISRHHDLSGHISDGDCFDFAALITGKTGQALLEQIDADLGLHILNPVSFYSKPQAPAVVNKTAAPAETKETTLITECPKFSFFKAPIRNILPYKDITLRDAYAYITGPYAAAQTQKLRSISSKEEARAFKANNFAYATFSGTFSKRANSALKKASNLMCLDFDHVPEPATLAETLKEDECLETALLFRSPSGDGIKWIIQIDYEGHTHEWLFGAISNYILNSYGVEVDKSGKDIARACFLPHDPAAYINPNFIL